MRGFSRVLGLAAALALASPLAVTSPARAATGAIAFQSCIGSDSDITGCTLIPGAVSGGNNTGLNVLRPIVVSADGKSVYSASRNSDAIARFDRDPATGALTYQDCISSNSGTAGCTLTPDAALNGTDTGLDLPEALALSADGKGLYAASVDGDAIARFARDPATGALTYQDCISSNSGTAGCTLTPDAALNGTDTGLDGLEAVAVSDDGRSVYTASGGSDAVARFARDAVSGALTYQDCISSNGGVTGCTPIPGAALNGTSTGLNALESVAVSADGKSIYTASREGDAIARFARDPATGALTYQDCISSNSGTAGCTLTPDAALNGTDTGLDDLESVAVSADGESVYAASPTSDSIARFDRDPTTGALSYQGCFSSNSGVTGCAQIAGTALNGTNTAFNAVHSVAVSDDGRSVYTASGSGDAIARFDRDPATGALTYQDCISSNSGVAGCTPTPDAGLGGTDTSLDGLESVAVSADGQSVYAASGSSDAVATFDREPTSNKFSFGKLKRNERKGTAKLTVEVPGPGALVLAGRQLKEVERVATAAGKVRLPVKAKGKAGKKLRKRGKLKVRAKVTYTPTGGPAKTKTKKLKLVRRR